MLLVLLLLLLCKWILAFYLPGVSNLFTGSTLNALDLYMKYTIDVVHVCKYIVWFTSLVANISEFSW